MAALTAAAVRSPTEHLTEVGAVAARAELARVGIDSAHVAAQLAARRWRTIGLAIVLHNGPLTRDQRNRVALINCGPRAVLTSFTAAADWGLRGWERQEIYVLAPAGTARPPLRGILLHRTGNWVRADIAKGRRLHRLGPALVLAAASFDGSRPGCGILAASVQPRRWIDDQLRQNEIVIGGTVVLRYPSIVVRDAPHLVADQLRRIFGVRSR